MGRRLYTPKQKDKNREEEDEIDPLESEIHWSFFLDSIFCRKLLSITAKYEAYFFLCKYHFEKKCIFLNNLMFTW